MGLGTFKWAWQRQTKDFAHEQASKYSSLIFDNRGLGESDCPTMRYSTSEMALDTIELLDHVGWMRNRSIHVVGISMGGMIAQELVRCGSLPAKRHCAITKPYFEGISYT
jgi:pimeloyl-ACP methyl ester carboxylesterase